MGHENTGSILASGRFDQGHGTDGFAVYPAATLFKPLQEITSAAVWRRPSTDGTVASMSTEVHTCSADSAVWTTVDRDAYIDGLKVWCRVLQCQDVQVGEKTCFFSKCQRLGKMSSSMFFFFCELQAILQETQVAWPCSCRSLATFPS